MNLKTCKDCFHEEICINCELYDDVLNVSDYCKKFKNTADVIEVVRCKDCEFYKAYSNPLEGFYGQCLVRECDIGEYDFCSYGTTKEGASSDL